MKRYITDPGKAKKTVETDVLVIGSGVAGVYTALKIDPSKKVTILAKEDIDISNSALAQGGIAVSLGAEDTPKFHKDDTVYAGAGLSDEEMVWIMVSEARRNILELCNLGVNFDMSGGELSLTREAAHSQRRIIHAGDFTGKEVCDKLLASAEKRDNIVFGERMFAIDFITDGKKCVGVLVLDQKEGEMVLYKCSRIICASGGFGQLYQSTTNPIVATGDGIAMAYRAGAELSDMEFVQFHPTTLYHEKDRSFLISEAVRGEGAVLRNKYGERFMSRYHELEELAPRDIVARSIFNEMHKTDSENVYLDITMKDREYLKKRFPKIFETCLKYGIDISKDYIPVAPAEHYCMGGVRTDSQGRTGIEGLYACGEVSCTGIHGANRLASNSLLEGLVFGNRIARDINESEDVKTASLPDFNKNRQKGESFDKPVAEYEMAIKHLMNKHVGIIRNGDGLEKAFDEIKGMLEELDRYEYVSTAQYQVINMATVARLVISSAIKRTESRGAHFRSDFPEPSDSWKINIINKKRAIDDETYEFED
jgi:L-aspartate oxidase